MRHPRHFLGVPFKRSQIDFICRFESAATGASLGNSAGHVCLNSPLNLSATVLVGRKTKPQFLSQFEFAPVPELNSTIKGDGFSGRLGKGLHYAHQLVHQMRRAAIVVAEQDGKPRLALDQ